MCDLHDEETTMGRRAPSHGTFLSQGRIDHTLGRVGASQESSARPTEDGDVDDVARGVAGLFPSRSSPRPCSGLCPLPAIREESASEDEDEREWVGSRASEAERDILPDTPAHGLGRITADPSIQDIGNASRQLGSADDVTLAEAGACASGTGDALDVCHQYMDHRNVLKWLLGRVRRRVLPSCLTKQCVSSASTESKTKRAECRSLDLGDDDPSYPRDGRTGPVSVWDALVGLLPSTHPRDLHDTILLSHGGVEVSSLSSYVGERVVGSHREREDRY